MDYCTRTNLEHRFGAGEVAALATGGEQAIERAISDASRIIDAKLRGTYTLPFSSVPDDLIPLACDLARFLLFKDAVPDVVQKRYDSAMAQLRDFSRGFATLDVPDEEDETSPQTPVVTASAQVFTDDLLGMMP